MPSVAASRRPRSSGAAACAPDLSGGPIARYARYTQSPLASLLFVLPLLVLHEFGIRFFTEPGRVVEFRVTAVHLLHRFFGYFGATGRFLPALAVVAVLLAWHGARRDSWKINLPAVSLMFLESLAWAFPLVGVYLLCSPVPPQCVPGGEWKLMASLYLGAGVYEELIFRLGCFALGSLLLVDAARFPGKVATPLIVVGAAGLFAAYHLLGHQDYPRQAFVFATLRGIYYGVIFLERGFGLSVGVHTAYDLLFLTLQHLNGRGERFFST